MPDCIYDKWMGDESLRLVRAIELLSVEVQDFPKNWAYTNEAPLWIRSPKSRLGIYPGQEVLYRV